MAAKLRRGYTSTYNHGLQKGSVWRITGIFFFRLLLSKTELSATLTPFFFFFFPLNWWGGDKQITMCESKFRQTTRGLVGGLSNYGMKMCCLGQQWCVCINISIFLLHFAQDEIWIKCVCNVRIWDIAEWRGDQWDCICLALITVKSRMAKLFTHPLTQLIMSLIMDVLIKLSKT